MTRAIRQGLGRTGVALGALGKAKKIMSGGNLIDMTEEVVTIRIYGPQVINQNLYQRLHGIGYKHEK